MREYKTCHCEISENIRKHEKSQEHKIFLGKAIFNRYVETNINLDRLKDLFKTRIKEHVKKFTEFTIIFCWKVNIIEYSDTIVKKISTRFGIKSRIIRQYFKKVV